MRVLGSNPYVFLSPSLSSSSYESLRSGSGEERTREGERERRGEWMEGDEEKEVRGEEARD